MKHIHSILLIIFVTQAGCSQNRYNPSLRHPLPRMNLDSESQEKDSMENSALASGKPSKELDEEEKRLIEKIMQQILFSHFQTDGKTR